MGGLLCDEDGIPLLIQSLSYNYRWMCFVAIFFNDEERLFCSSQVCRGLHIVATPSNLQMLEAENNINKFAKDNWGYLMETSRCNYS